MSVVPAVVMITEAGELSYPTKQDVDDAVQAIRDNLRASRLELAAQFAHWYAIADDGVLPPLEVKG